MNKQEQISVYFRSDGGREDGLGHLSRCLVLADALAKNAGNPPVFITHAPDGIGARIVGERGYDSLLSPAAAGNDEDLSFVLETLKRARAKSGTRPLLVIDSRRVDSAYVRYSSYRTFVTCLDDEALRDLPCDLLINGHVWASAQDYPPRAGREILAGPEYNLIPPAFFTVPQRRVEQGKVLRVLITLGGEDPHNHTAWVLRNLGDLLAGHNVTIILGPAHPDPMATKTLARQCLGRAQVIDAPPSLVPHMAVVDLAITAGGITCYELAAARIAQLAIIVEDHQRPLVEAMESRGCLVALGSHDALPREKARDTFSRFVDSAEARGALATAAAEVFPDSGVPRVSDAIVEAYQEAS